MNNSVASALVKITTKGFIIVKFQDILLLFDPMAFF